MLECCSLLLDLIYPATTRLFLHLDLHRGCVMSFLRRRFASLLRRPFSSDIPERRTAKVKRPVHHRLLLEGLEERVTPAITNVSLDMINSDLIVAEAGGINNDQLTIRSDNANSQWIISDPTTTFTSAIPGVVIAPG